MATRLYFLVPDENSAKKVVDVLRSQKIDKNNIHAVAKKQKYPLAEGIPDADLRQTSDVVNAAKRGATLGGAAGLFAGLAAVAVTPLGLIAAGGAVVGMSLAGATAATWTSTMIGISVPNTDLQAFQSAIDDGKILMLVDVDHEEAEAVSALVMLAHPGAVIGRGTIEGARFMSAS